MNHTIVVELNTDKFDKPKEFVSGDNKNEIFDVAVKIADPNYNISQEDNTITLQGNRRNIHIISTEKR